MHYRLLTLDSLYHQFIHCTLHHFCNCHVCHIFNDLLLELKSCVLDSLFDEELVCEFLDSLIAHDLDLVVLFFFSLSRFILFLYWDCWGIVSQLHNVDKEGSVGSLETSSI